MYWIEAPDGTRTKVNTTSIKWAKISASKWFSDDGDLTLYEQLPGREETIVAKRINGLWRVSYRN